MEIRKDNDMKSDDDVDGMQIKSIEYSLLQLCKTIYHCCYWFQMKCCTMIEIYSSDSRKLLQELNLAT